MACPPVQRQPPGPPPAVPHRSRPAAFSRLLPGLSLVALLLSCGTPLHTAAEPQAPQAVAAPALSGYPRLPRQAKELAELLVLLEQTLRNPATPEQRLPELAHQQQVLYRVLAQQPAMASAVGQLLPARWRPVLELQLTARREFLAMRRGRHPIQQLPAWRIQPPAPAEQLLRHYREASAATGIPWEVLAAVNLVESAMGRIDGVSVANAHGPMQFLPSTWAEPGIGAGGDIRNPRDAIHAAARYLVRRGGLKEIRRGLWGYNNSAHYGRAVLAYAALLKADPNAYRAFYHWQVHVLTEAGDVWLPVGYNQRRPIAVAEYLRQHPEHRAPQD